MKTDYFCNSERQFPESTLQAENADKREINQNEIVQFELMVSNL